MSDIVIHVENLSKRYRIGARQKRANTLRETLGNLAASPFDYLRRTLRGPTEDEIIWALKAVSFEVKRGEVVGIPSAGSGQALGAMGQGRTETGRQGAGETGSWGDKEQGGVSPCHPLSSSPCLHFPHHRADGGLCRDPRPGGLPAGGGHRLPSHPPLSPRKQGEGRAGEHLPERRHPFDGAQGRPGHEEGGDLS